MQLDKAVQAKILDELNGTYSHNSPLNHRTPRPPVPHKETHKPNLGAARFETSVRLLHYSKVKTAYKHYKHSKSYRNGVVGQQLGEKPLPTPTCH